MDAPTDTRPEIALLLRNMLREATPAKKLALVGQMNKTVITLAMAGLRSRFPEDPPAILHRRLADLILGKELASKVYGPIIDKV